MKLLNDIFADYIGGRGRIGMDGDVVEGFFETAELAVIRAEIVPPLRDAVRLVDGDQRGLAAGEELGESRDAEALRSDEQEIEITRHVGMRNALRVRTLAS